jgi:UDP-glucuronate decarboxylase
VDHVIHGASIASPTWYRRYPLETIDVNVNGTRALLDLARGQEDATFLYLSSSEIYGDPPADRIPTSEEYWGHVSCTGPRACYDESKRLAETLTFTYQRLHGLPIRIVRPFNVYGPRLRLDDGRIIPDLLKGALAREPIVLYSDGRATRSFCYVADFAAALLLLLGPDVPDGAYNVGNDEEVTIEEAARVFDEVANEGRGVRFESSEDAAYLTDNPQRRCPDLRKVKAAIPWTPAIPLREGLARTYASYLEEERT